MDDGQDEMIQQMAILDKIDHLLITCKGKTVHDILRVGEIQVLATQDERNENSNPFQRSKLGRKVDMLGFLLNIPNKMEIIFGEVSLGLGPFGLPVATKKKKYVDKIKLSVIMRDALNKTLKGLNFVSDEQRKKLVVFGWTQIGFEINLYVMTWYDIYCTLKELENKLSETESIAQTLHVLNIKGKRRNLVTENIPILNN
ncbi:1991_t:CDS:2 [Entrophospora sp. SA101]|nr:1991_t:CDS:2 [Entrophospora sp. SA101]